MSIPQIRTEAIEAVGRKILMEYDPSLLSGQPCPVPIETIIETKFDLILEFHSEHDMGVGIVSRRMGVMDCKISNHAFGNKLLLTKLPDKDSILVGWYLSWDGKHPPPCKLGVPLLFHRFGGVP